jgi:hypothetical protein
MACAGVLSANACLQQLSCILIERTLLPMRPLILGGVLLATLSLAVPHLRSQTTAGLRVPDAATALKIAEPRLIKTYGKRQINYERPLTAKLDDGIWTVYGTLCCPDRNGQRTCEEGRCVGGVAVVKLRQRDGKILSIMHYK